MTSNPKLQLVLGLQFQSLESSAELILLFSMVICNHRWPIEDFKKRVFLQRSLLFGFARDGCITCYSGCRERRQSCKSSRHSCQGTIFTHWYVTTPSQQQQVFRHSSWHFQRSLITQLTEMVVSSGNQTIDGAWDSARKVQVVRERERERERKISYLFLLIFIFKII